MGVFKRKIPSNCTLTAFDAAFAFDEDVDLGAIGFYKIKRMTERKNENNYRGNDL